MKNVWKYEHPSFLKRISDFFANVRASDDSIQSEIIFLNTLFYLFVELHIFWNIFMMQNTVTPAYEV